MRTFKGLNKAFFYSIQSALKNSAPTRVGDGTVNWSAIAAAITQGPAAGPALPAPRLDQDVTMESSAPAVNPAPVSGSSSIPPPKPAPAAQTASKIVPPTPAAPGEHKTVPVKPVARKAAPTHPVANVPAPVSQPAAKKRKRSKKDEELTADETEPPVPPPRAKPSTKKRTTKDSDEPSQSKKFKSAETVETDDDDDAGEEHEGEEGGEDEDNMVPSDSDPPEDIHQVWRIRAYHLKNDTIYKAYGTEGDERCNHCKLKGLEHCWTVPGLKCQACRASKIRCDRRTSGKLTGEKVKKLPKQGAADEHKGMCTTQP